MTEVLGKRLQVAGWTLQGGIPPGRMLAVLRGAVARMGMSHANLEPAIWQYPVAGKGGTGYTYYHPFGEPGFPKLKWHQKIVLWLARKLLAAGRLGFAYSAIQPLTESFIVADYYAEADRTYVFAASCVNFNVQTVGRYLSRQVGPILNFWERDL